jgi:hypothetical protein
VHLKRKLPDKGGFGGCSVCTYSLLMQHVVHCTWQRTTAGRDGHLSITIPEPDSDKDFSVVKLAILDMS